MPRSKTRKHHHEQQRSASEIKEPKKRGAVPVTMFFFAIIGACIAYFSTDGSIPWVIGGLVLGVVAGYFFGRQFEKSLTKK